jgi:hypothetical protein
VSVPRIIPCFHSTGTAPTNFAVDLARALRYSGTLIPHVLHEQSCYVEAARNKLVRSFLAGEGTHMMMLDVDLSFEADAFLKTFTMLEQYGADVLYGNYALGNSGNSLFGSPENLAQESAVMVNLKANHVYDGIVTGGTGWLMARRTLLQRMLEECPGPWPWFPRDPTSDGKDLRGEDISFGLRMFNMTPRPRVLGTTAVLLRHFKTQPFILDFMQEEAMKAGVPAITFPNPYENNPRYLINGHTVIDKETLTPEQLAQVEADLAGRKEEPDARDLGETEKVHGSATSPEAKGEEDQSKDERGPTS